VEELQFTAPHPPTAHALDAFGSVLHEIKTEIIKSRHHWDQHEPRMWSRAAVRCSEFRMDLITNKCCSQGIADHDLAHFDLNYNLVQVRSAPTAYGTIILGKIRLPAVSDEKGEGFVHVRIHHSTEKVCSAELLLNIVLCAYCTL
jgi:hypothetical protein